MVIVTERMLYCDGCGEEYATDRGPQVLRADAREDGWRCAFGWAGGFRYLDACPGCDVEEVVEEAREEAGFELRSVHR